MNDTVEEQLVTNLLATKRILFESLVGNSGFSHLHKERAKIKKAFDHAFIQKLSTSLIVVGGSSNESLTLVRSVLESYSSGSFKAAALSSRFTKNKNYTARVNGSSQQSDHEALVDMANQFLLRNERDTNINIALEDLEDHFKQCRLDGIPAIIVLEDFHAFAKRPRQTLIYTLLDLMHKKDLLFTIVGITDHADVDTKLEKRVLSRLNAQYVFVSKASGRHICEHLYNAFTIPAEAAASAAPQGATRGRSAKKGTSSSHDAVNTPNRDTQPKVYDALDRVSSEFGAQFNAQVSYLFGKYEAVGTGKHQSSMNNNNKGATPTRSMSSNTSVNNAVGKGIATAGGAAEVSTELSDGEGEQEQDGPENRNFLPGILLPLLNMHSEWGRDLSFFVHVGMKAVSLLSVDAPLLSSTLFHTALASMEGDGVEDTLLSLTSLELHLFIAVLHIHGRTQHHGGAVGGVSSAAGGAAASMAAALGAISQQGAPAVMKVANVFMLCDMLVEVFKQNTVPKCRVIQALCNLAQKGLIFMVNAVPGRTSLPVGAVSLGVEGSNGAGSAGVSSYANITQNTLMMLNVSYHEAVDAFRPKKSALQFGGTSSHTTKTGAEAVYTGKALAPILVSERLRKAVLEPLEPIVYQSSTAGAGIANSVSISAHQALVDTFKSRHVA